MLVRGIEGFQKLYVRSIIIDIQQKGSVGFLYVRPSVLVRLRLVRSNDIVSTIYFPMLNDLVFSNRF